MTSRRLFLGSVAAAGVGAAGVTTLDFSVPVSAQPRPTGDPVVLELQRQMRAAMVKMRRGDAEGVRGASALLSLWAARIESSAIDRTLQDLARKHGRNPGPPNHAEMERQAKAMGSDLFSLSVHVTPDPKVAGRAYEALVRGEKLTSRMREAAAALEAASAKWPKNGFLVARAQLGDNGDPNNYRNCPVCAAADGAWDAANYICGIAAAASLIPGAGAAAVEACGAAMAVWLALEASCQAARLFGC